MKNKEKYAKEIADLAVQGKEFAVDAKNSKIVACDDLDCKDCYFRYREGLCSEAIKKWAEEECKDFEKESKSSDPTKENNKIIYIKNIFFDFKKQKIFAETLDGKYIELKDFKEDQEDE